MIQSQLYSQSHSNFCQYRISSTNLQQQAMGFLTSKGLVPFIGLLGFGEKGVVQGEYPTWLLDRTTDETRFLGC